MCISPPGLRAGFRSACCRRGARAAQPPAGCMLPRPALPPRISQPVGVAHQHTPTCRCSRCIIPLRLAALGFWSTRCRRGALRARGPAGSWWYRQHAQARRLRLVSALHRQAGLDPALPLSLPFPLLPAGSALQGPRAASQLHGSGPALGSSGAIRDGLVAVRPLDGAQKACGQAGWLFACPTLCMPHALAEEQAHAPHCTLHRCACTPRQLVPAGVSTASLPRARITSTNHKHCTHFTGLCGPQGAAALASAMHWCAWAHRQGAAFRAPATGNALTDGKKRSATDASP